jgi:hypothetical protein
VNYYPSVRLGIITLERIHWLFFSIPCPASTASTIPWAFFIKMSTWTPRTLMSRKRKLDVTPVEIAPYRRKPRMDKFEYPTIRPPTTWSAELSHQALKLDTLFMVGQSMDTKTVPMLGGFNARIHQDKLPKQVVHYLPNINKPINRDDVVAETMRISMKCAEECEQRYGLVTYDLDDTSM